MTSFQDTYLDQDHAFFRELYPDARRYLLLAKDMLRTNLDHAETWKTTILAMRNLSESMCFHILLPLLDPRAPPSAEAFGILSDAIDTCLWRARLTYTRASFPRAPVNTVLEYQAKLDQARGKLTWERSHRRRAQKLAKYRDSVARYEELHRDLTSR